MEAETLKQHFGTEAPPDEPELAYDLQTRVSKDPDLWPADLGHEGDEELY
jgi:hypothetical protein